MIENFFLKLEIDKDEMLLVVMSYTVNSNTREVETHAISSSLFLSHDCCAKYEPSALSPLCYGDL